MAARTETDQEISEEFKPTEIGPLPVDWDVAALSDLATIVMGQSPPSRTYNQEGVGLPFLQGKAEFGDTYPTPIKHCSAPLKVAPAGAVVISVRAPVGDVNIAPFDCCIGRGLAAIQGARADSAFLFYWLRFAKRVLEERGTGTTFQSINRDVLASFAVPLAPPDEQRAIAHVLSTIQQAIEATDRVIASARQLKRSLMRHVFTYGPVPIAEAERVPLKETEIGPVPRHWDMVRLGKVAAIGNGSTPKRSNPAYWEGGAIPWLTSAKVHETVIRRADQFVTELARAECHLPTVRKGSVVVAITGQGKTLGNAALVTFDTCISQHLAYIQLESPQVSAEFVLAYLHRQYADLRRVSQAGGSTKGALTCGFLKGYPLPLPPLEEQQLAADALTAVDRRIEAEEKRKAALRELFRTMLHLLMTGQVRVKPRSGV